VLDARLCEAAGTVEVEQLLFPCLFMLSNLALAPDLAGQATWMALPLLVLTEHTSDEFFGGVQLACASLLQAACHVTGVPVIMFQIVHTTGVRLALRVLQLWAKNVEDKQYDSDSRAKAASTAALFLSTIASPSHIYRTEMATVCGSALLRVQQKVLKRGKMTSVLATFCQATCAVLYGTKMRMTVKLDPDFLSALRRLSKPLGGFEKALQAIQKKV
jgi:hypothetical protein